MIWIAGAQEQAPIKSQSVYGQIWRSVHDEIEERFGSLAAAQLYRPKNAPYRVLVVNGTALFPWRYAHDARTELDVSAGYIKLHDQNQSPSGSTWRVELARLISPTQRVSVHALRQVTDASQLFRLNINAPVPTNVPTRIVSGQPFTDREYGATWRFQENRTSFQLDVLAVSQRYQAPPGSNFDATVVSALFGRQLSPVLNWDVGANYEHNSNVSGKLDSLNAITRLRWQVGPRVGLRFIYAHSTTSPHGYGENQVGIMASYALLPVAAAGPQAGEVRLHPIDPMSSQQPRR